MLSEKLSSQVLTVCCTYNPPRGGVAQVVYTYSKEVYPVFKSVVNSKAGPKIRNLWYAVSGMIKTSWILLTDRKVRIVHIHSASRTSFYRSMYFVKLAHFFGRKVVLHIHGGGFKEFYKTNPQKIKKELISCDAIVALSESWRKYFEEEVGLRNVFVVNNIIEDPQIKIVEKDDKFHILFLGLITEAKGIFDLLDSMRDHKEEWHNRIMLHVGGNGKVEKFKQEVADYELEDMVVYEGWVSGEKKASLFNLSDAYILPSYTEGVPISILESMSYGVPVLSTPVGGIPEVIRSGENGILFQPGDKSAIASAINNLLNDKKLCRQMSERELGEAKDYFPESIAEKLVAVYNSI